MATVMNGIPRKGIDSTGGLDYILIADYTQVKITETDGVATITMADDTAISDTNNPFKKYYPEAESASITEVFTVTGATGQGASEQTATLIFSRLSTDKRNELKILSSLRTLIVGVDFNGYSQVMGIQSGALISSTNTTGTVGGDLNGATITPRAPGGDYMPSVEAGVLAVISVPTK